jgi:hypothetical protein
MKSKEEIEQLAEEFSDDAHGSPTATFLEKGFIHGYTQCQEDMKPLLEDLFSLWQSLAEVGEISVGKNFTKKHEELKSKLNKQD